MPLETPAPPELNTKHARHLYTILLKLEELSISRDEFQQKLYEMNIGTGIHFIALHLHPYYQDALGYKRGDFPNAEFTSDRTISLNFLSRSGRPAKKCEHGRKVIKKNLYCIQ